MQFFCEDRCPRLFAFGPLQPLELPPNYRRSRPNRCSIARPSKQPCDHRTGGTRETRVDEFERRFQAAEQSRDAQVQMSAQQQADAEKAREWFVSTWSEELKKFIDSTLLTDEGNDAPSFGPRGSETHNKAARGRVETFRYTRTGPRFALDVTAGITLQTSHNFVGAANAFSGEGPRPPQKIVDDIARLEQQSAVVRNIAALHLTLKDRTVKDDPGVSEWFLYALDHGKPHPNVETHRLKQLVGTLVDRMGARRR
jgi:hypothetical protein